MNKIGHSTDKVGGCGGRGIVSGADCRGVRVKTVSSTEHDVVGVCFFDLGWNKERFSSIKIVNNFLDDVSGEEVL